jgi:phosphatidate phosphatase LPIN
MSSDELRDLGLKLGENKITYEVKSSLQGSQMIEGKIFLLNNDSKIIISDVDGTLTK